MKGNHRVHEPIIPCCPPVCRSYRAVGKPGVLDGDLSKPFWQVGEWMDDFHDIEGDRLPRPWKHTKVKVLWDDEALYIGAELQDDTIWATVMERDELIPLFVRNQDAATFRLGMELDDVEYVVVYNTRLPFEIVCRGIARELGHIVLGHDGVTRPYEIRRAEAMCYAHHLLSPRPILQILRESMPLTMNILSDTTGCIDECVEDMQSIPGAHVPAELNRQVRDLFARGIREYIRFHQALHHADNSQVIDLGTYMDGYEE